MNLKKLFDLQHELDIRIEQEHNLQNYNLLPKKILALLVELGELANETRCFKFWSNKGPSEKQTILEEYVDCLHFILSIGLERNFTNINLDNGEPAILNEVYEQLLSMYNYVVNFSNSSCIEEYIALFKNFLALGYALGFSDDDIENAYIDKNNINHKRQDEGY